MLLLIPPPDPREPSSRRVLVRLLATLTTCGVAAWACSLGWIPAVLAMITAKHILVAILLMDLGVDRPA
jgi:hypothetical protein